MITESDNDAQDTLWDEIGMTALQRFLTAAGMNHTVLGTGDYWGLTEINAHDELRLLQILITRNTVLDAASRRYALALMADVVPDQRWGVAAGAPDVTVHLKNGWLPDSDLWDVNSIGDFTRHDLDYSIVVLTSNDPDMAYGVATVETVARLINLALVRGDAAGAGPGAGTSPERSLHHPADGHHPRRREHCFTHTCPNVGKHPCTGWRRWEDHGYLLCVKRTAFTLEHDGGKHVRDIRRSECGRIAG